MRRVLGVAGLLALIGRGWGEIGDAQGDRSFTDGFRRVTASATRACVDLTVTGERGWLLFLPSSIAVLGAAAVLVLVGKRSADGGQDRA